MEGVDEMINHIRVCYTQMGIFWRPVVWRRAIIVDCGNWFSSDIRCKDPLSAWGQRPVTMKGTYLILAASFFRKPIFLIMRRGA